MFVADYERNERSLAHLDGKDRILDVRRSKRNSGILT
jgi:hypothetical protein